MAYTYELSNHYPPFYWRYNDGQKPPYPIVAEDPSDKGVAIRCDGFCGIRYPHTNRVHVALIIKAGGRNGLN